MSDELISRKETERILRAYADDVGCNRGEYVLANGILKAVSCVTDPEIIPTAYDADKVVKQLENLRDRFYSEDFHIRGILEKAIEIVKSGGVSND